MTVLNIHKLCWLTDVHLNFIDFEERCVLYQKINDTQSDALLITGDIAEAPSIKPILNEIYQQCEVPIFFVLGNHDYYRGDIQTVRQAILELDSQNPDLYWLGVGKCHRINNDIVLVGHDTWADGRNGDYKNSPVQLADSRYIADLFHPACLNRFELHKKMQQIADEDASELEQSIINALNLKPKEIVIACHVPPFAEASWHIDKPSDKFWQPFFSSKVTGDILIRFSEQNPEINFKVYCGHTHTAITQQIRENLTVFVGQAEYYHPSISDVLVFGDTFKNSI